VTGKHAVVLEQAQAQRVRRAPPSEPEIGPRRTPSCARFAEAGWAAYVPDLPGGVTTAAEP
jgi:hypothetical protein